MPPVGRQQSSSSSRDSGGGGGGGSGGGIIGRLLVATMLFNGYWLLSVLCPPVL